MAKLSSLREQLSRANCSRINDCDDDRNAFAHGCVAHQAAMRGRVKISIAIIVQINPDRLR
jgi:hypothetical protein